jgi:rhodanese-related sulfurtransferase
MNTCSKYLITISIAGLAGIAGGYLGASFHTPSNNARIAEFYATENAVHVSPHGIRKDIAAAKNDFVLVDLRSAEEYEKEHIVGAVNIPAYKDKDHSDYGAVERIVGEFQAPPEPIEPRHTPVAPVSDIPVRDYNDMAQDFDREDQQPMQVAHTAGSDKARQQPAEPPS